MTPRPPSNPLSRRLTAAYAAHRRALTVRTSLRAGAACSVVVATAVIVGAAVGGGETTAWVRLGLVLAVIALLALRAAAAYRTAAPSYEDYLERIEGRFPETRSWLRNALDFERRQPTHGSAELAAAVSAGAANRLAGQPLDATRPRIEPQRPIAALAGALLAVVAVALVSPPRALRSWQTLLDPRLAAPAVRLEVEPGSVRISPGASLTVRARVWGTSLHPNLVREGTPALAASFEGGGGRGARVWRFDLSQLTREQLYRVRVARVTSPAYRIALAGEPSAVSFEIEYVAPAYARLPVQRGTATRGDLSALRGTRARIVATFDRDLVDLTAAAPGRAPVRWAPLTPRRWTGEIPVIADGEYELRAAAASGSARLRYRVSALADAPPVLAVQMPVGDLDLPAGQQIPLAILAQDDLGLARLRLQYRKDADSSWQAVPLSEFRARPREAAVRSAWDASSLGLLPGQSATFRFELEDNNVVSGPGRAVSPTFELRFPSLADLYQNIDRAQGSTREALEKAAEQAREVQKSLDRLARQPPRAAPQGAQPFERSEEMKSALQRQQELGRKIDEAASQLNQTLERAAERQAFDEELMAKLREMSDLVRQIQSPEFRDALRRMQEALERMDRRQLDQSLPEWRAQNREMVQQLQRTIELLKQMREEEQLQALAQRAKELKAQQDALNREHGEKSNDPSTAEQKAALPERQEAAANQTEQLAKEARELAAETDPQSREKLEKASQELTDRAAPKQRQAAKSARGQQCQQGQEQGQEASESLEQAEQSLSQMAEEAQARRREVDLAAVRRAAQDLVSLQRESERTLSSPAPDRERGDRQSDLSDGVARVADSLYIMSQAQPFISPRLGSALGRAINSLQESGRQLTTGNLPRGQAEGRGGGSALNEAILELRATEERMGSCQRPGQGKPGGRTGQMMGEIGRRQAELNQETRNLTQRLSEQMRLSAGDQARMRQLADEQARLREQVEQIQRDEELKRELLGRLDAAQKEMREVEETLQRGDANDELGQKQQRILSRLLDAQRSVNRRDFDPQRESRPGEDVARLSPAELPADLLRESDRLRLDLLKAQSDRYPAQYRAYVEAYLRSLNQQRTPPAR